MVNHLKTRGRGASVTGVFARSAVLLLLAAAVAVAEPAQAGGPAVSGPNGKIEFDAGALALPSSGVFFGRFAGTITLPLGAAWGLQVDGSVASAPGLTSSAALHVFTRDPASYLIGGTLGMVQTPGATVFAAGPEAELYFGNWTLEAWGGLGVARPNVPGPARVRPFVMADLAYYVHENWRVSAGISVLDGFGALHFGSEYLFDESAMPLAFTADARLGQDGSILATIGLRGYFGDAHKSLVGRHREDDPWDRGSSLYTAIGGSTLKTSAPPPDPDPGQSSDHPCNLGFYWWDGACIPVPQG